MLFNILKIITIQYKKKLCQRQDALAKFFILNSILYAIYLI